MADDEKHFNNKEVTSFCEAHGVTHITMPSHSPWVNGLIEGSNKILLQILRRLCAPDHDSDSGDVNPEDILENWPAHLDEAIHQMNGWILIHLSTTPRELLFG
jgi:transposase InsO family protein